MRLKPKRLLPPRGGVVRDAARETARGSPRRSMKRKVVSPNGVVMENIASVPPSSLKRSTSLIIVPPRSSSRRKVCSMSSTSNTTVPTPSGCLRR